MCAPLFTAALLTVGKTWEQLKCPSADNQTKKTWDIHSGAPLSHT